jgi:hypothetical protein
MNCVLYAQNPLEDAYLHLRMLILSLEDAYLWRMLIFMLISVIIYVYNIYVYPAVQVIVMRSIYLLGLHLKSIKILKNKIKYILIYINKSLKNLSGALYIWKSILPINLTKKLLIYTWARTCWSVNFIICTQI